MPIISVRDNESDRWKRNTNKRSKKNKDRKSKGVRGTEAVVKGWQLNGFSVHFELGFSQLIGKAVLIFKSILELALSIILKERELYESKHVAVECRCLKIWDLLSFLICSSILVLKWWHVSQNIARTIASTSKFIC